MPRNRADEPIAYFATITVLDWIPVFIDRVYCDIVIDSLRHCRANRGLQLFAYVLMPNHLHLIATALDGGELTLPAVVRDLKKFTSRVIHEQLRGDGRESILRWMNWATEPARRSRGELGLWQDGFHPIAVYSNDVFAQKARYIHENPVRKGLVVRDVDWWYSSARNFEGMEPCALTVNPWVAWA